MPAQFTWLISKRVLYGRFHEQTTAEELNSANETITGYFDQCVAPVIHAVYNMADSEVSVRDIQRHLKTLYQHPRMGWLLIYGLPGRTDRLPIQLIARFLRIRVVFVNSYQEALTRLRYIDHKLPDLTALADQEPDLEDLRKAAA